MEVDPILSAIFNKTVHVEKVNTENHIMPATQSCSDISDGIINQIKSLARQSSTSMGQLSANLLKLNQLVTAITTLLVIFAILLVIALCVVLKLIRKITKLRADIELVENLNVPIPARRNRRY